MPNLPQQRRRSRQLRDDNELQADSKNRAHERRENLRDSLTEVSTLAVYVVPTVTAILGFILLLKYILTNDWQPVEHSFRYLLVLLVGYLVKHLQDSGIEKG